MKRTKRTQAALATLVLAVCIGFASQAFAWGSATHAYICDHLGARGPVKNLNEIYGGMAPDVFNYLFSDNTLRETLYAATHYGSFTDVGKSSHTLTGKALALGFISHNGLWGADATAHGVPYNNPEGYVVGKAIAMRFKFGFFFADGGQIDPNDLAFWLNVELYHNAIESAVDILLCQKDRALGGKIAAAALARSPEFPAMLVKSYRNLAPENLIRSIESDFRRNLVAYGFALAQPQEKAVEDIATQLASMAGAFLAMYGIDPSGLGDLDTLAFNIVNLALEECEGDYLEAVKETIQQVSTALNSHHITD
ncbi:MAG: hypothetical protein MUE48_05975 [Desulfobacterales bacterium]|nr:hypothetical protein [Desulfobacterales bacterium]